MIVEFFGYHNPECDCCGAMLGAEKSDEAAEAAMEREGWQKVQGKDVCTVCLLKYKERGELPRKFKFYKEEPMNDKDMIEQAEEQTETDAVELAEAATTAEGSPSLFEDAVRSIGNERERIEEADGARFNSAFESYAVLNEAIEEKAAVEKDLKENLKNLWTEIKAKNGTSTSAYLKEIERVARQSAMAWVRVAAIAQKAEESL